MDALVKLDRSGIDRIGMDKHSPKRATEVATGGIHSPLSELSISFPLSSMLSAASPATPSLLSAHSATPSIMTSKVVIRTEPSSLTPERRASFDKKEETQRVADILLSLREAEGDTDQKQELPQQNSVESRAHLKDAGRMPAAVLSPLPYSAPKPTSVSPAPLSEVPQASEIQDLQELEDDTEDPEDDDEVDGEEEFYEEEGGLEDGDDDDWIENPKIPSLVPRKIINGAKRKKAPSGSACEKHKRWKKRCPDDCPLRKPRWRFIHNPKNEEAAKLKREDTDRIVELLSSSRMDDWITASRKLNIVLSSLRRRFIQPPSPSSFKPQTRSDYIRAIRAVIRQLRREGNSHTLKMLEEVEQRALCNEPLSQEDETLELLAQDSLNNGEDYKRKRESRPEELQEKKLKTEHRTKPEFPTIACERHTILHARCPITCPDRRPANGRPPRGRKPKIKKDIQLLNGPTSSASSTPSPPQNVTHNTEEIDNALKIVGLGDQQLASFLHQTTSQIPPANPDILTKERDDIPKPNQLQSRCPTDCPGPVRLPPFSSFSSFEAA